MVKVITDVLVCSAFIGSLVFVVRYLRTRWFQQVMGIHLMMFMVVVMLILGLAAATTLWGQFANRELVRLIDYSLLNIIIWWRVVLLFNIQHVWRRRKEEAK